MECNNCMTIASCMVLKCDNLCKYCLAKLRIYNKRNKLKSNFQNVLSKTTVFSEGVLKNNTYLSLRDI